MILALEAIWTGAQRGEVLWSKIGPYKLTTVDLQSLAPGQELTADVSLVLCARVGINI